MPLKMLLGQIWVKDTFYRIPNAVNVFLFKS